MLGKITRPVGPGVTHKNANKKKKGGWEVFHSPILMQAADSRVKLLEFYTEEFSLEANKIRTAGTSWMFSVLFNPRHPQIILFTLSAFRVQLQPDGLRPRPLQRHGFLPVQGRRGGGQVRRLSAGLLLEAGLLP